MSNGKKYDQTVVVIGTGFGACMTALPLARTFKARNKGETILMLERGTWWTTPVGTVQDPEVQTFAKLKNAKQPVQFWSSNNGFKGLIDILMRCRKRVGNIDGLLEFTQFGERGFLNIGWKKNDGISI